MKKKNFETFFLTFEELKKCNVLKTNRCGCLYKEESLKMGYSEKEWEEFKNRGTKLKKIILRDGFSNASFFFLAKSVNDNRLFLLDGQGRRMALFLMDESGIDLSEMEFPCLMFKESMTEEEMSKAMRDMNTGSTAWKTKDIKRNEAMLSNDPKIIEAYNLSKSLQEKYGFKEYVANLFLFGEKGSHSRSEGISLNTDNYNYVEKEILFPEYIRFLENVSVTPDNEGNLVTRDKDALKIIRNTNVAISLNTCLKRIYKTCLDDNKDSNTDEINDIAKKEIHYFVDKLIEKCNVVDTTLLTFFNGIGKPFSFIANLVKKSCGRKCKRNEIFIKSLYSNPD